jgi:deoxycytidine triphosphate deaminase
MSIKADRWIRHMAETYHMIEPFSATQVAEGTISYGLSSYGYDLRLADEFKIFTAPRDGVLNPKSIPSECYRDHRGAFCDIPPHGQVLGRTVEYLRIPRDVLTLCVGKSTYARAGILVNVTPFEPEWEGFVTVSIANTTPASVRIFANEGLCQVLFFQSDEACEISYKDRKGKYQSQKKIETAKT